MRFQKPLLLLLTCTLVSATGCQLVGPLLAAKKTSQSDKPPLPAASAPKQKGVVDKEYVAYNEEVLRRFENNDFPWIDNEARNLRAKKDRLPGGYFKLRALYKALEAPHNGDEASSGEWEDHIARLERWVKQDSRSLTARVGLASTWQRYAWKARGNGFANNVSADAMKTFDDRMAAAGEALREASSLEERCPHWYVTALWVAIAQGWKRADFDRLFNAAVELEPTYYYLYQAKATYLLPRWYGEEGETERFAEESALKIGGPQGDIVFFAIYSHLLTMNDMTFMNTRSQAIPRILDGFRSLERLYGPAPHRLNEAARFAVQGPDKQMAVELFERIGEDYDPEVWHSKNNYDMFRQGTLWQAKAERDKQKATNRLPK